MTEPIPTRSAETYQEGVCPVQSFVTEAIPVQLGGPIPPREGRPQRGNIPTATAAGTPLAPVPPVPPSPGR